MLWIAYPVWVKLRHKQQSVLCPYVTVVCLHCTYLFCTHKLMYMHVAHTHTALDKENVDSKPRVITLPGTKDKKSTSEFIELHIQESQVDSLMSHDSLEGEAPKPHSDARKTDRLGNDREGQRSRLPSRKKTRSVQVSYVSMFSGFSSEAVCIGTDWLWKVLS